MRLRVPVVACAHYKATLSATGPVSPVLGSDSHSTDSYISIFDSIGQPSKSEMVRLQVSICVAQSEIKSTLFRSEERVRNMSEIEIKPGRFDMCT